MFYVIDLLECCSCRCTISLYNAFMWTVSVKTAQSELNQSELHTNKRTHARTHARTDEGSHATLSLYIYCISLLGMWKIIYLDFDLFSDNLFIFNHSITLYCSAFIKYSFVCILFLKRYQIAKLHCIICIHYKLKYTAGLREIIDINL